MKHTIEIARDTKDPKVLIEIFSWYDDEVSYFGDLISEYATEVSYYAVLNPNCPPKILTKILKKGKDDEISLYAVRNLNCPPEMLAEVLRRGNNNVVSRNAANNENCPLEEKIKWMQLTGQIEKEDPNKHIIEYENIKEDDFQDLKDLL